MNPLAIVRHCIDAGDEYDALLFWCPAPVEDDESDVCGLHRLPISGDPSKRPVWQFDGNLDAPTLSPSILTRTNRGAGVVLVCHSYLRNGQWEFLTDCTHPLAGMTVPMVPLPDWVASRTRH